VEKSRPDESDVAYFEVLSSLCRANSFGFGFVARGDRFEFTEAVATEVCCRYDFAIPAGRNSFSLGGCGLVLSERFSNYLCHFGRHSSFVGSGKSSANLHFDWGGASSPFARPN
jgi:hypothetical protein